MAMVHDHSVYIQFDRYMYSFKFPIYTINPDIKPNHNGYIYYTRLFLYVPRHINDEKN